MFESTRTVVVAVASNVRIPVNQPHVSRDMRVASRANERACDRELQHGDLPLLPVRLVGVVECPA
jgi:hypothetical protein